MLVSTLNLRDAKGDDELTESAILALSEGVGSRVEIAKPPSWML